jgi:hypothetical protein
MMRDSPNNIFYLVDLPITIIFRKEVKDELTNINIVIINNINETNGQDQGIQITKRIVYVL